MIHEPQRADFNWKTGSVLKGGTMNSNTAQLDQDVRLDESQLAIMAQMIESGIEEREAKLRVLCLAKPPDHFMVVPTPFKPYPQMVYHKDGRYKLALDAEDHAKAKENGWQDQPTEKALVKLQNVKPPAPPIERPSKAV